MSTRTLGVIAGSGAYPFALIQGARAAGVERIVVAAFEGETDPALAALADETEWLRVGQLGRLVKALAGRGVGEAIMAGQIAPSNLFNLRPDLKALLLLAKLPRRNAETIFGAIAEELARAGVTLLPATRYMDAHLAPAGRIAGPELTRREEADARYGFGIAKEVSRLDIGQTVVVKGGTVLAVEGFEGTNAALLRGGALGKGAIAVKVSKLRQDLRFDVPVAGLKTIQTAAEAGLRALVLEAGLTLLLERESLETEARKRRVTIFGICSNQHHTESASSEPAP